jgi:hypothetical protein
MPCFVPAIVQTIATDRRLYANYRGWDYTQIATESLSERLGKPLGTFCAGKGLECWGEAYLFADSQELIELAIDAAIDLTESPIARYL